MKELLALISKLGNNISSEERVALLYMGEAVERNMSICGMGINSLCVSGVEFTNFISRLENAGQLSLEEVLYLTRLFFLANSPHVHYSNVTSSKIPSIEWRPSSWSN